MAHLGFDATQVTPDTGQLDPLPAGWYNVIADESELKPTNDGLGARLAVRFSVVDGQFVNRKIYTGFNLRNANPVAQEIAFKQLSAFAHAVGVLQVNDSQQLHNIPLKVRVKIKPAKDGYEAQNEITAFKNIREEVGNTPAPAVPSAPTAPVVPSASSNFVNSPQPWQQPAAPPAAPSAPPAFTPPVTLSFPPSGWTAHPHPQAVGYFYKGDRVLSETDLRAECAAPPAAAAPPAPPPAAAAPPAAPATVAQVAVPPWQIPKQ